jgi:DNA (cytosine-5)-methyltransferase 1
MRLLDLYCGAGGAAEGYHRAGFDEIVGVDLFKQKHYPFKLILGDALEYLARHGREFDLIHASPPCQAYTFASLPHRLKGKTYPDLIEPTRKLLKKLKVPYVMENVMGAPLLKPVMLCGSMFGLMTYRHRLFETSFQLIAPVHIKHLKPPIPMGRPFVEGEYVTLAGHFSGVAQARIVMDCNWMNQKELAQAIPPAYTKYIGMQFLSI